MGARGLAGQFAGEQMGENTGTVTAVAVATQPNTHPAILPAWTPPKTDWRKTDVFDLTPDYARMRGNLLHLRAWAARLYLPISFAQMRTYAVQDIPRADFFAAVDGNTDALLDGTLRPVGTARARSYAANAPVWSEGDLNRIENAHAKLADVFAAQENGRTVLKFTMGGGAFGACI